MTYHVAHANLANPDLADRDRFVESPGLGEDRPTHQPVETLAMLRATREVTLIASGSEVSLAIEAQKSLAAKGVTTAVVSLPCWELIEHFGIRPTAIEAAALAKIKPSKGVFEHG